MQNAAWARNEGGDDFRSFARASIIHLILFHVERKLLLWKQLRCNTLVSLTSLEWLKSLYFQRRFTLNHFMLFAPSPPLGSAALSRSSSLLSIYFTVWNYYSVCSLHPALSRVMYQESSQEHCKPQKTVPVSSFLRSKALSFEKLWTIINCHLEQVS